MNSSDRSPAMITHGVAVNFLQAREVMEREIWVATELVKKNTADAETLIAGYNSIHVGRKLQVIFLSGELREQFIAYVHSVLEALELAERTDEADKILARYNATGIGQLHPLQNFWDE